VLVLPLLFSLVCCDTKHANLEKGTFAEILQMFLLIFLECFFALVRFSPSDLALAIHELDETHVGCFSFRTRDSFLQVSATIV